MNVYLLALWLQVNAPWWGDLVTIVETLLIIAAAAGGTVGVVGLLKQLLKLDENGARIASWVVTGLMGVMAAAVSGQITPELFVNWATAVKVIVMIWITATSSSGVYQFQKAAGWFRR